MTATDAIAMTRAIVCCVPASRLSCSGGVWRAAASLAQLAGAGDRRRDDEGHVRVRNVSRRSAEDRRAHRRAGEARLLRRPAHPSRVPGFLVQWGDPQIARHREGGRLGPRRRRRRAASRSASPRSARSGCTPRRGGDGASGRSGAGRQPDLRHARRSARSRTASTPSSARSSPARTCRRGSSGAT